MPRNMDRISARSLAISVTLMLAVAGAVILSTWALISNQLDTVAETRQSFDETAATKVAIIGQVRKIFERDGVESDINAFATHLNDEHLRHARATIDQLKAALDDYRDLGVVGRETVALAEIAGIVDQYDKAYAEAGRASSAFDGVDDIDIVSVDTGVD